MLLISCYFFPTAIHFVHERLKNLKESLEKNQNMKMNEKRPKDDNDENTDHKSEALHANSYSEACSQNKKYGVNQLLNKGTPDRKRHLKFHNTFCSPLQALREKTKQEYEWISTPTGPASKSFAIPCNPFDVDVESLSMSSFSPSVFTVTKQKSMENMSFRWSIEQLAVLEPVDIDENSQQDPWFDKDKETKAQKAIDAYFSKTCIVPSPWTPTTKYVTSSPQIVKNFSSSSKEMQRQTSNENSAVAKEISTQTTLTIPPNINLFELLGQFYTYEDNREEEGESESSFASASLCNSIDMLSSSSLRRKLFINEEKLENPDLIKEKDDHVMASIYETPTVKKSPFYHTPSSDHFSSSPIAPRCWSLSMHHISMTSPDISPICAVPRKISFRSRFKAKQECIEEEAEKLEKISSLKKPTLDPLALWSDTTVGMTSELDVDSSCNVTWDMSKQENPVQQKNEDVPTFPSTYVESSSNQPDTGYFTGSLNSIIAPQSSSALQYRVTPVAELLEDCAISKFPQRHQCDTKNCSQCSKIFGNDDSAMVTSLTHDQSSVYTGFLKNVPWNPTGFSTPTKISEESL